MDKRTVYGVWSETSSGVSTFICGRTKRCGNPDECALLERCEAKALVDPSALAQVEATAARVPELERENERLNGLAAKAQGLYGVLTDLCESTYHFCESFCNKLKSDGTCEPDDYCPVWIAQYKAKANLVCYLCFRDGHSGILCPILNSEEDVAKVEEDARIGKAVRELSKRIHQQIEEHPEWAPWRHHLGVGDLDRIIAKAKGGEGTPHA